MLFSSVNVPSVMMAMPIIFSIRRVFVLFTR